MIEYDNYVSIVDGKSYSPMHDGKHAIIMQRLKKDKCTYVNGLVEVIDGQINIQELYDFAIAGVIDTWSCLSQLYFLGIIVDVDQNFSLQILEYYIKNSPSVSLRDKYRLGRYYEEFGKLEKAKNIFFHEEMKNFPPAVSRIGLLYKWGKGVAKDISQYEIYMKRAVKLGHMRSKSLLARYYLETPSLKKTFRGYLLAFSFIFSYFFSRRLNKYHEKYLMW